MKLQKKCLRNGRCNDLDPASCLLSVVWSLALLASLLIMVQIVTFGLMKPRPTPLVLFVLELGACVLVSTVFTLRFQQIRDHKYYLVDLPFEYHWTWVIPAMMIGVFPALIISYVQLRQTRKEYAQADLEARYDRDEIIDNFRKRSMEDRFPVMLANVIPGYCVDQWHRGLNQKRVAWQRHSDHLSQQIIELEQQAIALKNERAKVEEMLRQNPESAQPSDDEMAEMKASFEKLQEIPGILTMRAIFEDEHTLADIIIKFHLTNDPEDQLYDLGIFELHAKPDRIVCELVRSSATASGKVERLALNAEDLKFTREILANDTISGYFCKGQFYDAVCATIDEVRRQMLKYTMLPAGPNDKVADHYELRHYFLPLWPVNDR